ncbi:hypothetical protein A7E78_00065 [Syntrophotalea acetylenivorans]|uniref:HTH tetR-type domain-containing protein n=2 Tax=Syntrophotalea acetylenivorans TaxID=1842532 RepID=A0A1L3GKH2_9BACT|nr:hypothetical protein A7E78_00065 [Syntrophotalea acetylenivorans]
MPRRGDFLPRKIDKRSILLEVAENLICRQGFHSTTLADISRESGISLGNLYYYYKTKNEILSAVTERQIKKFDTYKTDLDLIPDPRYRLVVFIKMSIVDCDRIAAYGCSVGSLSQELNKGNGCSLDELPNPLKGPLDWASEQFRLMGKQDANALGGWFFATLQGAALLANSFKDTEIFVEQAERLIAWVDSL